MIIDGVPFGEYAHVQSSLGWRSMEAFFAFLERKTGTTILFDRRRFPFGRADLAEVHRIASLMHGAKIIDSYNRLASLLPDEPPIKSWTCRLANKNIGDEKFTGGASVDNDSDALYAALAEALERYLWYTQTDYFVKPIRTTTVGIARRGRYIPPERFMGFSAEQRALDPKLTLAPDATYLWIQGTSLQSGKKVYVPAQVVSAAARSREKSHREPLIKMVTTIGLATWPEQNEARLRGALECIERDAYTILWLNQLTLPRISLGSLRKKNPALDLLLARSERYGLKIHVIQLLTDAPAHAILAVAEDARGHAPRFAFGLKAHRSLPHAIEKAVLEALRARRRSRVDAARGKTWDARTPVEKIGHSERTLYWAEKYNAEKLTWITRGNEIEAVAAPWESDTSDKHLERIIAWCRTKNYECVALSHGTSKANPTKWHVEMIVMPDLQPAYLYEWMRHVTGPRLTAIPRQFGYKPRETPYLEGPHPFA